MQPAQVAKTLVSTQTSKQAAIATLDLTSDTVLVLNAQRRALKELPAEQIVQTLALLLHRILCQSKVINANHFGFPYESSLAAHKIAARRKPWRM
jgi:hypothetical protein